MASLYVADLVKDCGDILGLPIEKSGSWPGDRNFDRDVQFVLDYCLLLFDQEVKRGAGIIARLDRERIVRPVLATIISHPEYKQLVGYCSKSLRRHMRDVTGQIAAGLDFDPDDPSDLLTWLRPLVAYSSFVIIVSRHFGPWSGPSPEVTPAYIATCLSQKFLLHPLRKARRVAGAGACLQDASETAKESDAVIQYRQYMAQRGLNPETGRKVRSVQASEDRPRSSPHWAAGGRPVRTPDHEMAVFDHLARCLAAAAGHLLSQSAASPFRQQGALTKCVAVVLWHAKHIFERADQLDGETIDRLGLDAATAQILRTMVESERLPNELVYVRRREIWSAFKKILKAELVDSFEPN